ncbi:MAG TPA: hypothetical protein PK675_00175 [Clostridia bacterium]|nr:hypothetical protein [Clostridia bacterium]
MKYCVSCGAEIFDDAVVCVHCGRAVPNAWKKTENKALGILAIIFGVAQCVIGFILSVIGLSIYKEPENKRNCKIGLGLSIAIIILYIILFTFMIIFPFDPPTMY